MTNIYYSKYINFLKRHHLYNEKCLNYIQQNALYIDYRDEDSRDFIGCFYQYKNGYLTKIRLCIPYIIDDERTVLINIHEYVHALILFQNLNTKYQVEEEREVLPLLFEKIYISENPSPELIQYEDYLNQVIKENDFVYQVGLEVQEELLHYYHLGMNIKTLNRKATHLVKKKVKKREI